MTPKHTPGPWVVVPTSKATHRWVVGMPDGTSLASCEPMGPWITNEAADANARLMAAAPDLLRALDDFAVLAEGAVRGLRAITPTELEGAFLHARNAIAKATA